MSKALCVVGAVVAILLLLMFGLDLAVKFPFDRINWLMDVGFIFCSLALGYMSWSSFMDQL
jgi:multisubunit Na+/H+ antiporter MnhB subunit